MRRSKKPKKRPKTMKKKAKKKTVKKKKAVKRKPAKKKAIKKKTTKKAVKKKIPRVNSSGVIEFTNRQVNKFLGEIVGKNGVVVLKACNIKKGVTDDIIANKTGLKLHTIRAVLNQLHYRGLIAYDREKNVDTNWYTYTWFAQVNNINDVIKRKFSTALDELQKKFDYESNHVFYACQDGCGKLPFELAGEYDFQCPDCGKEIRNVDNRNVVKEILQEIKEIEETKVRLSV